MADGNGVPQQVLDAGRKADIASVDVFFPDRDEVGMVLSRTLDKDSIKSPRLFVIAAKERAFHIIPIVDTLSRYVDQRVRVTSVSAESTLTRDTVPTNVDAIVFWVVWNAEKAILEVADFKEAILLSAQTALRESIGRHELAQMITDRESLGRELQRILDEKTNPWGVTIQSVEIRDVRIPAGLEDAMSRQAQAERERQARIILGQAETEISEKFAQAALVYRDNPVALHLRAMNMLYEAIKEKGAMVIVPSSAVETMGLGGSLAMASLNNAPVPR